MAKKGQILTVLHYLEYIQYPKVFVSGTKCRDVCEANSRQIK
jgi:hypothetical protein